MIVKGNNLVCLILKLVKKGSITSEEGYILWRDHILTIGLKRIKPT
jgi:hypothetical protein